jgi:hypothetical protein
VRPRIDHFEAVRGPANAPGTGANDSIQQIIFDGVSVVAFTVRPGDVQEWDLAEGNAGANKLPNERAEISYAPAPDSQKATSPYNVREGMTQTYDVDYRFKSGFPPHVSARHEWAVLTQFHPQPGAKGIPGFPGATFHDGQITFENPNGDGAYFAKVLGTPDTWIRIRMAVKWSADADGYAVVQDRMTGQIVGRYDGATIAPGEFKYVKQGYYRAGGLPEGTVYQTLLDVHEGDLTATAPAPAAPAASAATASPAPAQKRNAAPHDPGKPSVQPNDGARVLMQIRDDLVKLSDPRVQPQIDAANKLLGNGPWTP